MSSKHTLGALLEHFFDVGSGYSLGSVLLLVLYRLRAQGAPLLRLREVDIYRSRRPYTAPPPSPLLVLLVLLCCYLSFLELN